MWVVVLLDLENDSRYGLFFNVSGGSDVDCRCSTKGRLLRVSFPMWIVSLRHLPPPPKRMFEDGVTGWEGTKRLCSTALKSTHCTRNLRHGNNLEAKLGHVEPRFQLGLGQPVVLDVKAMDFKGRLPADPGVLDGFFWDDECILSPARPVCCGVCMNA